MKVRKCSIIGCLSVKRNPKVSFFTVPKRNPKAWNEVINNANGRETTVKFVCAEHFSPDDILTTYSGPSDVVNIIGNRLKLGLKKGAIPSIFQHEEELDKSKGQILRSSVSIGTKHLPNHNFDHNYAKYQYQNKNLNEKVLVNDNEEYKEEIPLVLVRHDSPVQFLSFSDLMINVKQIVLPKGWEIHCDKNEIVFYKSNFKCNKMEIEKQLIFKSTSEVRLFIYQHSVDTEKIYTKLEYPLYSNDLSQAIEILNYKNICQGGPNTLHFPGIHVRTATLENYGIWRHNSCPILLNLKTKCQSCKLLHKYFSRKKK